MFQFRGGRLLASSFPAEGLRKSGKAACQQTAAAKPEHGIAADKPLPHRADRVVRDARKGFFKAVKMERYFFVAIVVLARGRIGQPLAKEIEHLLRLAFG